MKPPTDGAAKGGPAALWNRRWKGAAEGRAVTLLGKWMFKAKAGALRNVLGTVSVRTAIEVGCGLGHTLAAVRSAGVEAVGVDISSEAVAHCLRKGLPASVRDLSEIEDRYDLVVSDGLLEHVLNFEPLAERMMSVSRDYVLLIQPNHDSLMGKTLAFLAEILGPRANVPEYHYRIRDFVGVFDRGGFRLVRSLPVFGDVFRLLLFRKEERP
ncbi:MAG: class I SAM-dependent methyltransferase [Candidatus Aminicenantes bacterium]|nr:class I SAM-dependent methyltransferase [Candidatus Aminicenantes bacterium]